MLQKLQRPYSSGPSTSNYQQRRTYPSTSTVPNKPRFPQYYKNHCSVPDPNFEPAGQNLQPFRFPRGRGRGRAGIMVAPEITYSSTSAAGNIARYYHNWSEIISNSVILRIASGGYSIQFVTKPICHHPVISKSSSPEKTLNLKQKIQKLLNTGAISMITKHSDEFVSRTRGFSRLRNLIWGHRRIIDLSLLNKFIHKTHFRMENPSLIQWKDYLSFIDLTDAFFPSLFIL